MSLLKEFENKSLIIIISRYIYIYIIIFLVIWLLLIYGGFIFMVLQGALADICDIIHINLELQVFI